MFSFREIANTGLLHYCIDEDYLDTVDLYLSRDLPHHNWRILQKAPSFRFFQEEVIKDW